MSGTLLRAGATPVIWQVSIGSGFWSDSIEPGGWRCAHCRCAVEVLRREEVPT